MENVVVENGVTVVELGRYYDYQDTQANDRVGELLRELADSVDPPLLLLDMSRTAGINSTFIGHVFSAGNRLKARKGQLAVCAAEAYCAEVLRIVRLGELFRGFDTRADAIAVLSAPG